MKNNLNTNIFKRLWNYISKRRYEKNLQYSEYKKRTPIWKYRIIKMSSLVVYYYIGKYLINNKNYSLQNIDIIENINVIISNRMNKYTNFNEFFQNLRNEVSNFFNIYIIKNNDIEEIVNKLDPLLLPKIKIMKVEKIISEEEIKNEPKEIIDKIEYIYCLIKKFLFKILDRSFCC